MIANQWDMESLCNQNGENWHAEWRKVFPFLFAEANHVLRWKLGITKDDSDEIANDTIIRVMNKFPYSDKKTNDDLRYFTRSVAFCTGIDWIRKQNAEKRGSGGVLSLYDEIGDDGLIRLELIFSEVEFLDPIELSEIIGVLEVCKSETLNETEKKLFYYFYSLGESSSEIVEKRGIPIGSIGSTIARSRYKLKGCLESKGYVNLFRNIK